MSFGERRYAGGEVSQQPSSCRAEIERDEPRPGQSQRGVVPLPRAAKSECVRSTGLGPQGCRARTREQSPLVRVRAASFARRLCTRCRRSLLNEGDAQSLAARSLAVRQILSRAQGRAGDGIVQESTPGQFFRSGRDMNALPPPAETGRTIYSSARSRSAATARRTVSCQSMPSLTRCRLLTVGSASEGRTAGSVLSQRAIDVQAGATHRRRRGRP
jgi:hypothetical protein